MFRVIVRMVRAILRTEQSKLPHGLPWLVSLVLAVLVAVELTRLSSQLLVLARGGSGEFEVPAGDARPGDARPSDSRPGNARLDDAHDPLRQSAIDVSRIVAAHLFGAAAEPATADAAAAIPPTAAKLTLTGTLAAADPKRGAAIITAEGKSAVYPVGASLGTAVVTLVYTDRIILDRKGASEALRIPRRSSPPDESSKQPAEVVTAAREGGSGDLIADNAGEIADVMRAGGPVTDEAGRMRGFRIYPGNDRSAFGAAGLHGGDVVIAINGVSVLEQNRQSGQDVFQTIRNLARATMTIERNGRTSEVTVDVAQAGSSMRPVATAGAETATSLQ